MSSGTAWLPDAARLHAYHATLGAWAVMLHGAVFLQYDRQSGTRAAEQLGSINWLMAVATRSAGRGAVRLRAMVSAEPWTVTGRGYPELLQVAEPYQGTTVTDRQHPHDVVSELAVLYERPVGAAGLSLYLAPVGEPALGPVAYMHRPSAAYDPVPRWAIMRKTSPTSATAWRRSAYSRDASSWKDRCSTARTPTKSGPTSIPCGWTPMAGG